MWYIWETGQYVGDSRPITRAIISKSVLVQSRELFRTLLFSNTYGDEWLEIQNIKTVAIDRRLGTDAASMTMTFANVNAASDGENLDIGYDEGTTVTKRDLHEYGEPGAYTYRRGLASAGGGEVNPWHHVATSWVDMFLPNRVIKTFQGYGTDSAALPWDDTKLELTGIWLIDTVDIDARKGEIKIVCRDTAKLLIEQRAYPPVIPIESYPLHFVGPYKKVETNTETTTVEGSPESQGPNVAVHSNATYDSSAAPWYGTNASVFGHRATHAFDGDESTYWISMRNSQPSEDWSYEWLDAACNKEPVNRIKFKPWKGNYTLYVCVKENGVWQGDATVPYNRNAIPAYPNTADTKYVKKMRLPAGEDWVTIDLDRPYNADYVRLTFTDLQDFGKISGGDYRAGVYEFQVFGYQAAIPDTKKETEYELEVNKDGNINDYVDIIKLFLAWGGFYWPTDSSVTPQDDELFLRDYWGAKGGRIWGDIFYSGAYPIEPPAIDSSYWDNKSIMDCINQVREILGFIGYVDSTGGFVCRPPNIWRNGNFVSGFGYMGESSIPVISEDKVLIDFGITVDDEALRSEIVVVSSDDPSIYGSFTPGYAEGEEAPASLESAGQVSEAGIVTDIGLLAGQQRVMLIPDYPFGAGTDNAEAARLEVEKFAYLVSLWIHWSYRKAKFRIPGNPGIEIDDQVRIFERITSETYLHYILGINSNMDMDSGTWTMDIDTHWLGNGPEAAWHMYMNEMPPALIAYLCAVGQLPEDMCGGGGGTIDLPDDWDWTYVPVEIPPPVDRLDEDLEALFPDPPTITYPDPDYDYEYGGTDGVNSPSSVSYCQNGYMYAFWPGTGPASAYWLNAKTGRFYGASGSSSQAILDRRVWSAFELLGNLFDDEGIVVVSASGKEIRRVRGSTFVWSNHSWGTALDVNGGALPWGKSIYSYSSGFRTPYLNVARKVDSYLRTKDASGTYVPVFKWGQNFKKPDPMHWQVCAKAEDIARGVWYFGP